MRPGNPLLLLIDTALDALGVGFLSLIFLFSLPVFGFIVSLVTISINPETDDAVAKLSGGLTAVFALVVVLSFALGASEDTNFVSVAGLAFCGGLLASSLFWRHGVSEEEG